MNSSSTWVRRLTMLVLTSVSLGAWLAIQRLDLLKFMRYPLDQFYVLWHEGGHSIAAALTGGDVLEMVINPGLGGHALIRGGGFWLFSPMGYIGAAIVGAIFFLLLNLVPHWSDALAFALGLFVIVTTSVFATSHPLSRGISVFLAVSFLAVAAFSKENRRKFEVISIIIMIGVSFILVGIDRSSSINLTFVIGMLTGGVLAIVGSSGNTLFSMLILNVFNFALMFNVYDRTLGLVSSTHAGSHDDAAMYARAYNLDPQIVATNWFIICILLFLITFVLSWLAMGYKKEQ